MSSTSNTMHVGQAIVSALQTHNVKRVFEVPGESFLPVLDGLYETDIETIVCRHEGGATYMAEAHGKLTNTPGVAMVTRGPGAANAFVGIHTAWQDATPLVLFVGLIPNSDRDRESFQEFDPKAWFGTQAKRVFVLDDPTRTQEVVAQAFHAASSGRPGPVIIGLPEDILYEPFDGLEAAPIPVSSGAVSTTDFEFLQRELDNSQQPVLYIGGPGWTPESAQTLANFAESNKIPVLHDWRVSDRVAFDSPANAGWLGYGRSDAAAELFENADLVIGIGALFTDVPTDGYKLRQSPAAKNIFINLDTALQGNSGPVAHHIVANPTEFVASLPALSANNASSRTGWFEKARADHTEFSTPDTESPLRDTREGTVNLEVVFEQLQKQLDESALFTFGAGNHCIWAQRYLPTQQYPSQLSAKNGSMGYSVPSAVASALEDSSRTVVTIAGDGEFLMNSQELATAVQYDAPILVIVVSNGEFSTIRDHQENHFPRRISGTQIKNPDFAKVAEGYGAFGQTVCANSEVATAIKQALKAVKEEKRSALINVIADKNFSLPAN
jgi:acetolactate synthase-1/2/3 large subunit